MKPSRTASTEGKKPARPLLTPASSVVTSQVPSRSLYGSPERLDLAPTQDPRTSHNGSNNLRGHMSQTKSIVSPDRLDRHREPQMCGVFQRRARSEPIKRLVPGPFISSWDQSTAPGRVPRVPEQNKAVHDRGHI